MYLSSSLTECDKTLICNTSIGRVVTVCNFHSLKSF